MIGETDRRFQALLTEEARRRNSGSIVKRPRDLREFQMSGDGFGGRFRDPSIADRSIGRENSEIVRVGR